MSRNKDILTLFDEKQALLKNCNSGSDIMRFTLEAFEFKVGKAG